jgi:hypothetical protein
VLRKDHEGGRLVDFDDDTFGFSTSNPPAPPISFMRIKSLKRG